MPICTYEQWRLDADRAGRPAKNSCVNCRHESTCGYSWLAHSGKRHDEFSFGPCILGEKSGGTGPFFSQLADRRINSTPTGEQP